jgi:hypothetical protein
MPRNHLQEWRHHLLMGNLAWDPGGVEIPHERL